jgi:oligopeptidase B
MRALSLSVAAMNTLAVVAPAALTPQPPVARKVPKLDLVHGDRRQDDYFWMRDKDDPAVASYLEAENAYAAAVMKPTEPLQETLYKEMLSHIQETDLSVPYRDGAFLYYSRTEQGKQYPIYCRKKDSIDAPEQVILDVNVLAEGETFMAVGAFAVSDDGNRLAYSTDNTGFREFRLHVKDLRTGALGPERIERTGSVAWAADNRTLFYTVEDAAKRQYRLFRHRVGEEAATDALVYEEKDELFRVGVGRSKSRAFLFTGISSHTTSEMRYLRADTPEAEWRIIAPRRHEHEYDVEHHGDVFYIRTNDRGRNFRLVTAPVAEPGEASWTEVVPHRPDVMLEGIEPFANHSVLLEREGGLPRFRVTDLRTGTTRSIAFPEPAYAAFPSHNVEWDAPAFRYSYQSMVTPASVYDYDLAGGESTLLKRTEVPGGFDPANYRTERLEATAADGVKVPVSIVYRTGLVRDGRAPLLLTGYGSYGFAYPVTFSPMRLALLDRGVSVAIAHIRGGGELGKPWHDAGRMLKKKTTFTDFIAVAEHLIAGKYTSPEQLVVRGGSAGGLLVGAALNMRPDLFGAALVDVPFVDVVNTMLDESLPLTVGEFEEWGNPKQKDAYDYIKAYCPYTNLAQKAYPAMLVQTSFNDSQVMYWEPAKYVAKLRTLKTGSRPLLLKTNMAAGHGGASGRYDALHEDAFDYAFMLKELGMDR